MAHAKELPGAQGAQVDGAFKGRESHVYGPKGAPARVYLCRKNEIRLLSSAASTSAPPAKPNDPGSGTASTMAF